MNTNISYWRKCLTYFTISKYKTCLELLNQYDTVSCLYYSGSKYIPKHYAGNFWWTNSNYLKKFTCYKFYQKYDAEMFLLSSKEIKPYYFNNYTKDLHLYPIYPREYV